MKKPRPSQLWQAAAFIVCFVLPLLDNDEGSEFGRITGFLISMFDYGFLLFIPGFFLTFFYPRVAAVVGFVACLLCFPLYFSYTAPGVFRFIFKGNYKVPLQGIFAWDTIIVIGLLSLAAAAFACGHNLLAGRRKTRLMGNV